MKKKWVWWKHGVIYQIYPRSFFDSNGDGVGDLPGIRSKLDYLQDLGVDAIWLSPIFTSPMYDFGYDIKDYRAIDPLFGTMEDFDRLLDDAHKRNIRIVLDLVMNHTSHEHEWFKASKEGRENKYRDYYFWMGAKRKKPNNWRSIFGGSAWEWDKTTRQYYLHSFLKEQPDLNWRNPAARRALFEDVTFWLDKGVDGFRLDVINFIVKDEQFRSNPWHIGPTPRPYDMQKHLYDRDRPEAHLMVQEFRALLDRYKSRMAVGEVAVDPPGNQKTAASYYGDGNNQLHLSFDFSFIHTPWKADAFADVTQSWYEAVPDKGWPCFVLSNHDQTRAITRISKKKWGKKDDQKTKIAKAKLAALFLLTQRGTPFIYYGEEIGMEEGLLSKDAIQDPVGKRYWPFYKGRDGCRLPMQWSDAPHGGFSAVDDGKSETKCPWLPLHSNYTEVNVAKQQNDSESLLNFYRALIAWRKEETPILMGEWKLLNKGKQGVLVYSRRTKKKMIIVVLNFTGEIAQVTLPPGMPVFSTHKNKVKEPNEGDEKNEAYTETRPAGGGPYRCEPYEGTLFNISKDIINRHAL